MIPRQVFRSMEHKIGSFWRLQAIGWVLYLAVYFFHLMLFSTVQAQNFLRILIHCAVGFLTTSLLRGIYRRVGYRRRSLATLAFFIVAGSLVFSNVWFWVSKYLTLSLDHGPAFFASWIRKVTVPQVLAPLFFDTVLFCSWSAMYFTIKLWGDWVQERKQTEHATLWTQANQYHMLRYQLSPHFLFNALNAIRALVAEDKQRAKKMITELSEFLRYALVSKDHPMVPFQCEIDAIHRYLAVEKMRYENKLDATLDLDSKSMDYPVISFLLHPLVENAVKYGMRTSRMPLRLILSARTENGSLCVEIRNTGKWVKPLGKGPAGDALGSSLDCIRRRLESVYKDRYFLDTSEKDGEVRVRLELNQPSNLRQEGTA